MSETIPIRKTPLSEILFPAFSVAEREADYYLLKRVVDVLISSVLLILAAPIMVFVAIAIKLDSRGPAIYCQDRVGCRYRWRNGQYKKEVSTFTFYKFRSMYHKTTDNIHREFIAAYIHHDVKRMASLQEGKTENGNKFKLNGDKRITRVGRFIRKTSLDELPQLWNVLKGEMSMVGPRPAIPYEVELYSPWHMHRLGAMPGLTGLWQVTARNSAAFDDMVRLDLEYIEKQSFWLDLKILILTPLAVLDRKCN